MYPQLYQAISDAIARGIPPQYIAYGLMKAGWPAPIVNEALTAWLTSHGRQQANTKFQEWLKKYHRKAFPAVVVMVILNTIASGIALLQPWPIKILADSAFGSIPAPGPLAPYTGTATLIAITSLMTLAIFLLGQFFGVIKDFLLLKLSFGLNRAIKEESFRHILHLPLFHQERLSKGDYIYRQNTVTNSLAELVLGSTSNIIESIIMICGVLIIMFNINIRLTVISIILVPFLFIIMRLLGPVLGKIAKELTKLASTTASHITESVDNAETVQAFTLEERQVEHLNSLWNRNYILSRKSMMWAKLFNFSNGLLIILGTAAVMYFGGNRVLQGNMSIGQLLIFMTYMGFLLGPIQSIASQITFRRQKLMEVHRIYEVLSDHEGIEYQRKESHLPKVTGRIEFQHVSYAYENNLVLDDVSLSIKPGEKVAIIGPSGAGKSTILKLIPLFIEPGAGRIMVDNFDVQTVSLHDLRKNIAWIAQSPQLFDKSIADNVLDGDIYRQISNDEFAHAVIAANVREFAINMPMLYNSPAGENGTALSGGQRQRIAIARALIKNAAIICMDEPTSALDDRSEQLIRESMGTLIKGKTVILVTHRLSLLSLMDRVLVLEGKKLRDVKDYGGYERYAHYLQAHEKI